MNKERGGWHLRVNTMWEEYNKFQPLLDPNPVVAKCLKYPQTPRLTIVVHSFYPNTKTVERSYFYEYFDFNNLLPILVAASHLQNLGLSNVSIFITNCPYLDRPGSLMNRERSLSKIRWNFFEVFYTNKTKCLFKADNNRLSLLLSALIS